MANILGISLGTRSMGYVLVMRSELCHSGIKEYKGKWSNRKLKKILRVISAIIERHGITEVAIKIPDILPVSKGYVKLMGSLNVLCEQNTIPVRYFSLSDLKLRYCGTRKANKVALIEVLLRLEPDLRLTLMREPKNKNYYLKVFEAYSAAQYLQ